MELADDNVGERASTTKFIELWDNVSTTSSEGESSSGCDGLEEICTQQKDVSLSEHRDKHLLKAPEWWDASPTSKALSSQAGVFYASCGCAKQKLATIHWIAREKLDTTEAVTELEDLGNEVVLA